MNYVYNVGLDFSYILTELDERYTSDKLASSIFNKFRIYEGVDVNLDNSCGIEPDYLFNLCKNLYKLDKNIFKYVDFYSNDTSLIDEVNRYIYIVTSRN